MRELRVRGRVGNREKGWMSFRNALYWRTRRGERGMQLSGELVGSEGTACVKALRWGVPGVLGTQQGVPCGWRGEGRVRGVGDDIKEQSGVDTACGALQVTHHQAFGFGSE